MRHHEHTSTRRPACLRREAALSILWLSIVCSALDAQPTDHRPGQFEHHPDIRIDLFAIEPDVIDPVCLTFDARGDCFVVEMRDYPYGLGTERAPGGTIRRLRDTNQDGRADESIVFADRLSFPTSLLAWREGILVLEPPRIVYLQDTDGDGRSDERQVIIDGLHLGVTDSNSNSLRFGLDGMIHVVNGGNGGDVFFPPDRQPTVDLGRADFAFDPERRILEKTAQTGGGFGLVFDEWGQRFTTHNQDYLQQQVIPWRYLERNPQMLPFQPTENISDHGPAARIYPIVTAQTRVNHPEQAGHFSSAGGMGYLAAGRFSQRLSNSIFVCDVVSNLVHRDLLRDDGPVSRARRAPEEEQREFIASRDPAFRPVGLEHGPDGALYLIDMQRDVIEHPDYIPERVQKNLDIRAGDDRGRIYRITPASGLPAKFRPLAAASTKELVRALHSIDVWRQEMAHRRLLEQLGSEPQVSDLEGELRTGALTNESAIARLRALWILDRIGRLRESDLQASFADPVAGVRAAAVQLAERRLAIWHDGTSSLIGATRDPHPRVRFYAALALDGVSHPDKLPALRELLMRDAPSVWTRRAVLLAMDQTGDRLLQSLCERSNAAQHPIEDPQLRAAVIREIADVTAASLPAERRGDLATWLATFPVDSVPIRESAALLAGLVSGWQRQPKSQLGSDSVHTIINRWAGADRQELAIPLIDWIRLSQAAIPETLQTFLHKSAEMATARGATIEERIEAIRLIGRLTDDRSRHLLLDLLARPEPAAIHRAAVEGLGRSDNPQTGEQLIGIWPYLSPQVRTDVIHLLLSRRTYHAALVGGLEEKTIRFSELNLDLEQRRTLLRWSTPEIAERAARFIGDEEYSNRKGVVSEWLARLPPEANIEIGKQVFQQKCAACHRSHGMGHRVGPDLDALAHRSVEDLLTHILDPNMSINPNYVVCAVELTDGQVITGILSQENSASVTLLGAEAKATTIPRDAIERVRTLETSLMPEGLEKELTPADVRGLIGYLQQDATGDILAN